jgi:spermidine synthase
MKHHLPLYVIVFVSGAVVLAIEIVGTRVLGPFYGVGLFLWSALITITLAALAVGYAVGGRWADRNPRYGVLAVTLAIAGVWILATIWLKRPVIAAVQPLGLRGAVLASSFLLFFPPLVLLGITSPYAIRLRARHMGEVGRTAGDIYAVSTVASVVSALATGFFLIPELGVNRLIAACGVSLLAIAVVAWRAGRAGGAGSAALSVLLPLACGWAASAAPLGGIGEPASLAAHVQSPYADLRVLDWEEQRFLLIDGGTHTIVYTQDFTTAFPYAVVMDIPKLFFETPGEAVLVGLGGGSVARSYYRSGWKMDSVEIDAVVARMAEEYFSCDPESAGVHIMDGREFFLTTDRTYDVVLLDAFGSSSIPFHLVTMEAFALVKSRMRENGVLAINVEARTWHDILVHSLGATLSTQFAHVVALPLAEPQNTLGNLIILAADRPLELPDDAFPNPHDVLQFPYLHWMTVERTHAWDNRFEPFTENMPVLTDDLNPVELWAEAVNARARRLMHEEPWYRLAY